MQIVDLNKESFKGQCVVGLGNFDGFHLGHQSIFKNVKALAKLKGVSSAILIFKHHTKVALGKKEKRYLTSFEDKIAIAEKLGLDTAFLLEFDNSFSKQTPQEFISLILKEKMGVTGVVVGENFLFGHKASGNIQTLKDFEKEFQYETIIANSVYYQDEMISSTRIRNALCKKKLKTANACLGRFYRIYGNVVHGKHRGRKLGFPTANIQLSDNYLLPSSGVYLTITSFDGKKFLSMTSIGENITFNERDYKIESHLIDFNDNLYGEKIKIEFVEFIRDNIKFNSVEELIEQIKKDVNYARKHEKNLQKQSFL